MIAVVDYGAANLLSITRALEAHGAEVLVTRDPDTVLAAAGVVLPGVGAAGSAMAVLRSTGMDTALREVVNRGTPLLGLCLGLQLLFEHLAEDDTAGLGLLKGDVPRLPADRKVPHMGWNHLEWTPDAPGTELFAGLTPGCSVYFVHSYHCVPAQPGVAVAWTDYGRQVVAAVARERLWGMQFHPEKSGSTGLHMLRNWLRQVHLLTPGATDEVQLWPL